jgi:hypothetical protein
MLLALPRNPIGGGLPAVIRTPLCLLGLSSGIRSPRYRNTTLFILEQFNRAIFIRSGILQVPNMFPTR